MLIVLFLTFRNEWIYWLNTKSQNNTIIICHLNIRVKNFSTRENIYTNTKCFFTVYIIHIKKYKKFLQIFMSNINNSTFECEKSVARLPSTNDNSIISNSQKVKKNDRFYLFQVLTRIFLVYLFYAGKRFFKHGQLDNRSESANTQSARLQDNYGGYISNPISN